MKTLYKNSKLIALVVVGTMLMAAGTAVAVSHERQGPRALVSRASSPELLGRFVVTPTKAMFTAASTNAPNS